MLKKQICHCVQKKTPVLMISLDNDPAPLLGLTDVTCCPCHVCVLECDPHDIGTVLLYHVVLYCIFFEHNVKFVFSSCLLLSVFYTRLMRPNKVETGCGLLT